MKKSINRDLILFIILIPLFLWSAFYISIRVEGRLPAYSVINKSRQGCSVFYEALKKLKYSVDRSLIPIEGHDVNTVQIAAEGKILNIEDKEISAWVEKGGTLIYLTNSPLDSVIDQLAPEIKGSFNKYKKGKGQIIVYSASHFTNKALTENTSGAYELIKVIEEHEYKNIYFNESHLYSASNKQGLWDSIPLEIKYILYQLLIVIGAFFYYKGKRFGKAVPLYEEEERNENEYLYSAAALYKQAKCWDLMLENYYNAFLRELKSPSENWLDYWKQAELPSVNKAKRVYEFMHSSEEKRKPKDYMQTVTLLEQLTNILKKRRELYWKTLKRTQ
jgi:hypothetical protein